MINDTGIEFYSSKIFASMEDIKNKYVILMVDLSKSTFNKKVLSDIVALDYKQFCSKILPLNE